MTTTELRDESERLYRELTGDMTVYAMGSYQEWSHRSGKLEREYAASLFHDGGAVLIKTFRGSTPEAVLEAIARKFQPVGFDPVLLGC